ncbi:MAG: autotransporter domain-containing protein [Pseudomonadota bacterium]
MSTFSLSAVALALLSLASTSAGAVETYEIHDSKGVPFIRARFFGVGDGPYTDNNGVPVGSTWNLSPLQKEQTLAGLRYWAQIINATPGQAPAIINIGTESVVNAHAYSPLVYNSPNSPTQVQAALQDLPPGALTYGAHGEIGIGLIPFSNTPYIPSQLPLTYNADLTTVIVHEVAHALGITSTVRDFSTTPGVYSPFFGSQISAWAAHLRDDNGKAAGTQQLIYCTGCENPTFDNNIFDVRRDKAYFAGDHVSQVLAGSMPGVPVRMLDDFGRVDPDYMSHIELKNSLMSHQTYRNYTGFMEAELAILQDLGYQIDRRNFFGSSIYGSGLSVINDNPYFGRNADGTAYIANTYNTATMGLGLHVYGSFNSVTQRADLLSLGAGSGGIRVDGEGNTVTILPGTRVYADGDYARGVMFAYGKDHTFVQRGDVQALGNYGIAASFDFGSNSMGNDSNYRGSYIHFHNGTPARILDEINGPLVGTFDLTGRLAGKYASIYMSDNGYVSQINVMRGASLSGNILSAYSQVDPLGAQRLTKLTFGLRPDANGRSTNQPDSGFALRYDGNIVGINNLSLQLRGGTTQINGSHAVYDVNVEAGATLSGSSRYQLNPAGLFTNSGTLASQPLGGIAVDGNYVQTPTGRLQVALSSTGEISPLAVTGNATLAGTLSLAPQRGWYADGYSLASDKWLSAGSITGAFAGVSAVLASPSLSATATALGGSNYQVTVTRAANAYARYGADGNGQRVGMALDQIANGASTGLQPLIAALDFSASDGSAVTSALNQLSPSAYGAMFTGGLLRERQITDAVAAAIGGTAPGGDAMASRKDWRAFAMPFGSGYWRNRNGDQVGSSGNTYGLVFGAERIANAESAWTIGAHGALSGQSTHFGGQAFGSGKTTAFDAGVHARYVPDRHAGPHAFALARVGLEDGRVDRTIAVNGYSATPRGAWTGLSAAASIGGGWRWKLANASSIGPIAALDYTALQRPDLTETGADGARLQVDSNNFQSLRARLGGEVRFELPTADGNTLTARLQSTWNRELKNGAVTQAASFAEHPSAKFSTQSDIVSRDSLGLQAGLSYRVGARMSVEIAMSGNFYRGGDSDVAGTVSATWRF